MSRFGGELVVPVGVYARAVVAKIAVLLDGPLPHAYLIGEGEIVGGEFENVLFTLRGRNNNGVPEILVLSARVYDLGFNGIAVEKTREYPFDRRIDRHAFSVAHDKFLFLTVLNAMLNYTRVRLGWQ